MAMGSKFLNSGYCGEAILAEKPLLLTAIPQ
jgi:hypothetical protein